MEGTLLTLHHRPLIQPLLFDLKLCLSEYSFANLYLFREVHKYRIVTTPEGIWIAGQTRDNISYWMPTFDLRKVAPARLLALLDQTDCFFPIPKKWSEHFNDPSFTLSENPDDADYLFKKERIANYPGRNLSKKRNLLKQFHAAYKASSFPYDITHHDNALRCLEEWRAAFPSAESDYEACKEGLSLSQELQLEGRITYIDGQPAGFLLGERLQPKVYVIHFAKANIDYKGIYPYLYNDLANSLPEQEICLNWEQDLGQIGLRQTKHSYQPDKMGQKFRISKTV